jgi:hypothetical protein
MTKTMFAVALLTAVNAPAFAQAAPSEAQQVVGTVATPESLRLQLALELVKMTYPAKRAREASLAAYEADFRKSFLSQPQNVAAAARHPGLVDAMAAAGRDEMGKITDEIEPKVLLAVAQGVSDMLSQDDIRRTVDFYRSPAGQAMLTLDPASMSPDGTISIASLPEEQRRTIGRYQQTGAAERANRATGQALARIPTVIDEVFPPYQPRLTARLRAAANAVISAKRPTSK